MLDVKKYGIIYLLLIIVVVLFVLTKLFPGKTIYDLQGVQFFSSATPSATLATGTTVIIDFGDQKKTYTNISASNAYLALVAAAKEDKLEVSVTQYDSGVQVEKIGTFASSTSHAWVYYVNGQANSEAADKKMIQVGDTVEWRYVQAN